MRTSPPGPPAQLLGLWSPALTYGATPLGPHFFQHLLETQARVTVLAPGDHGTPPCSSRTGTLVPVSLVCTFPPLPSAVPLLVAHAHRTEFFLLLRAPGFLGPAEIVKERRALFGRIRKDHLAFHCRSSNAGCQGVCGVCASRM